MKRRLLFATDLHASDICFRKLLSCVKVYKADILLIGGDITGKAIIPIVERTDGTYVASYLGRSWQAKNPKELENLETLVMNQGYYPYKTSQEEYEQLSADKSKLDGLFRQLMFDTIVRWINKADDFLKEINVMCYFTGGNDDPFELDSMIKNKEHVEYVEGKALEIEGYETINCGFSNITPWKCPRDISEEELSSKLRLLASNVKDMSRCIFNVHCPPYDTGLDTAPQLDENFKFVTDRAGHPNMIPVGSTAVRESILRYQPLLSLHGHIHESPGVMKLGRTLCLNPGSEYSEGVIRTALIVLDSSKVASYQFLSS